MAALIKLAACALAVCMMLGATVVPHTQAQITCATITTQLRPCIPYLRSGGNPPSACCGGVRNLRSMARSTADRRTACNCLKSASRGYNMQNAASLPGKCNVQIGYSVSPNVDCSRVS